MAERSVGLIPAHQVIGLVVMAGVLTDGTYQPTRRQRGLSDMVMMIEFCRFPAADHDDLTAVNDGDKRWQSGHSPPCRTTSAMCVR